MPPLLPSPCRVVPEASLIRSACILRWGINQSSTFGLWVPRQLPVTLRLFRMLGCKGFVRLWNTACTCMPIIFPLIHRPNGLWRSPITFLTQPRWLCGLPAFARSLMGVLLEYMALNKRGGGVNCLRRVFENFFWFNEILCINIEHESS